MFKRLNFKDKMTLSYMLNVVIIGVLLIFSLIGFWQLDQAGNNWTNWAVITVIITIVWIMFSYYLMKWSSESIEKPIKDATDYTNKASREIDFASSRFTGSVTRQMDLLKDTEYILKKLSTTSEETKQSAQTVADKSNTALDMSKKGQESMRVNIRNMSILKQKIETIAEQILELSEHTQQIGSIIGVVEDITEQTNMLALNAAVEAARAGEHGRGFAVVASEIRKLSDQCKQATMKITSLIYDIQQATNSTVMATEEGTKEIEAGANLANQVAVSIDALRSTMIETVNAVEKIVQASKEQSKCALEVSDVMSTVNKGIKDSVEIIERSRNAAVELEKVSTSLQEVILSDKINSEL